MNLAQAKCSFDLRVVRWAPPVRSECGVAQFVPLRSLEVSRYEVAQTKDLLAGEMLLPYISPAWCFKRVSRLLRLLGNDTVVTKFHNPDDIIASSQVIDGTLGDSKLSRTDNAADMKATWVPRMMTAQCRWWHHG